MLQMGVIRPSESAWASPVVLVPKPDGEIRFCVDYRKLNAVTRPDNYPMPRTDELLEKLGRAQFISTLDLTKGYWQVPLDESAKERSAFITHLGLYEFNVLPFGLRNAPATFQRLVDGLLAGLGEYAVAYLDDVAIFSDSWADHLEHLQKVLERIREAGLTVKAKKCQIGLNRVTYLGHQVGKSCVTCQIHDKTAVTCTPPLQPVPLPESAWEKVAIDIVGPFDTAPSDCHYAITLIDYFSKWPEVVFTSQISSATVIKFLSSVFSR
ncbi:unnamed protein product [Lepidochelys kempii]